MDLIFVVGKQKPVLFIFFKLLDHEMSRLLPFEALTSTWLRI